MNRIAPEELDGKLSARRGKGRSVSALGSLIREMSPGDSYEINLEVDHIPNPYSAYNIAKSVGKSVSVFKVSEMEYIIRCNSAETVD